MICDWGNKNKMVIHTAESQDFTIQKVPDNSLRRESYSQFSGE
jgi:hypothetical protein